MRLSKAINIADIREVARRRSPRFVFDYIDGAAEDERGAAENQEALRRAQLVPRYLVDVSSRSQATELFGRTYDHPFGIAPMGLVNLAWPGGDTILAKVAAAHNVPYTLSTAATTSIEDAAAAAGSNFWFQLYGPKDDEIRADVVRRAEATGAEVLLVTVDIPVSAKRERDQRNGLTLPFRFTGAQFFDAAVRPGWSMRLMRHGNPIFEVLAPYADPKAGVGALAGFVASQLARVFTWADLEWLRQAWPRKLLVKGLMAAEDARLAKEYGADGVVLSNHGGRQLDAAPASFDCIAETRSVVGDDFVILADSGVRRGADIAKMLAAGADFVFLGRAMFYGVAAGGAAGAEKAFDILAQELDTCMGQIGVADVPSLRQAELRFPARREAPVSATS